MKRFWRNNIFTNPRGWAENCVGKRWAYRFIQAFFVFCWGCSLFLVHFTLHRARLPWISGLGLDLFFFNAMIGIPFCILRALRFYVVRQGAALSGISA